MSVGIGVAQIGESVIEEVERPGEFDVNRATADLVWNVSTNNPYAPLRFVKFCAMVPDCVRPGTPDSLAKVVGWGG
jgi:hypothetical protein